ncbi:MAG TPA: NAD-dependent epimerase/dehydratase family protein, partial [Acidimicrobiia bacterium]|nr:NAD-dependent epimerase/dehydratase family protein [Acidimicrobiia bacterium]
PVPFSEDALWKDYPEETNAPYGIAKRSLLVMLQAYRAQYGFNGIYLLPANLYGPGDNFDPETSHVIPALIRKFDEAVRSNAPVVTLWGTGKPTREFLHVRDAARAIAMATERYDDEYPVNIGTGAEISIADLANTIARITGYDGEIRWDASRPDGQPRRCLDVSRAKREFGFEAEIALGAGLAETIAWWRASYAEMR